MAPLRRLAASLAAALVLPALFGPTSSAAASSCHVHSGAAAPAVVELYTSEGCSSCPPADRWLSRLKNEPTVVALAFHVDYWDRLGWKDRFASPDYTQRQAQQQAVSGARFSYTPQVIVNGIDRPDWPRASIEDAAARPSPVDVRLSRDGPRVTAVVAALRGAPARLAAYWAVTEQNHVSAVKAGENEGATLIHDDVVREYRRVPVWAAAPDGPPATLQFELGAATDPAHPRQVNLVIVDSATGRPVQAARLGC
jgi:hypothetical protein